MSMRTRFASHFGALALALLGGTFILATPAHAGFNGIGLRGGWNFDTMDDMKGDAFEGSFNNQTGYNMGLFLDFGLGPIGIRPGATYLKTGPLFEGGSFDGVDNFVDDFSLDYVILPIDLRYGLGIPIANPFLTTGPELRFLTSSSEAPDEFADHFKDFGMNWSVGIGAELGAPTMRMRFTPEVRYSFGISGIVDDEFMVGDTTISTNDGQKVDSWRLSLGVLF